MKKLTLATAVLGIVSDLTSQQRTFSAYDVTRSVRNQVNSGDVVLTDPAPGKDSTYVAHYSDQNEGIVGVRDIVHDIFRQQDVTGYTVQDNGNHLMYFPDQPLSNTAANATNAVPSGLNCSTVSLNTPLASAIVNYVLTKSALGITPTLKQIQSAVKRKGSYDCETLADEAEDAGLKVNRHHSYVSKSTVSR